MQDFPFELYSGKSMLEYQLGEALYLYMQSLPSTKQKEIEVYLEQWAKKYHEEIRSKVR